MSLTNYEIENKVANAYEAVSVAIMVTALILIWRRRRRQQVIAPTNEVQVRRQSV